MTDRLVEIFSLIPNCETFADIGCDHGYVSYAMLKEKKAKKVIFSDVSAKCLKKAEDLLDPFVKLGLAEGIVSDGFLALPEVEVSLIAGMGGEEIVSIINNAPFLPKTFILQPMKNSEKVRALLILKGYKIIKDYTFYSDKKYYDLILATVGKDTLTEEEIYFGRTNLLEKPTAFIEKWQSKKEEIKRYLSEKTLKEESKKGLLLELERIEKYVK